MPEILAFREDACPEEGDPASSGCLIVESGPAINLWAGADTMCGQTDAQATLDIPRNQHVVIGRQQGGRIEYLDPDFVPTQILPQSGQSVLKYHGNESDNWVSRGHFMLRGRREGLVLVNGVPRRGGGVRPPLNGTKLLCPDDRYMNPGEELLIEPGTMARIRLPNGTVISIQAI